MRRWRWAILLLSLLAAAGAAAVVGRALETPATRSGWGYLMAAMAFLLSSAQGAPVLAWATRVTHGQWARPLRRPAELWHAAGGVTFVLVLLGLPALPPLEGRQSLWLVWRFGAPALWDALALLLLTITGLALLYFGSLPDLARRRDRAATGWPRRLSLGWDGASSRWPVLESGLTVLGGFYLMLYVLAHTLVSLDFSMSLVPGWRSAVYPPFHAVTGLQGGVAVLTLTALAIYRSCRDHGGLERQHFRILGALVLVLSLFRFYFWWSDFIVKWYGRTPADQLTLGFLAAGPGLAVFLTSFGLAIVVPFLLLIWNGVRGSVWGPSLASVSVLAGLFLDRVRLYVLPFSIEDVTVRELEHLPSLRGPDLLDVLMVAGVVALALLLVLGAAWLLAPSAHWERAAGERLRRPVRLARAHAVAVAKPE